NQYLQKIIDVSIKNKRHLQNHYNITIKSLYFIKQTLNFTFSKRTGKIKHVMMDDKIIATLRTDGGFAITLDGARFLLESNKVKENCIIIKKEVVDFIKSGRSVFCKHVISCGRNIEVESDAIILDDNDRLVAVGKAILPYSMIIVFKRGAAVRVRHSIND
ncbi:MAG: PUA domain-containing protein, partial [Candidatus Nitrosocaldaceae archaeon]